MTNQLTEQMTEQVVAPGPQESSGRLRFDRSGWWRWSRRALAVVMVLMAFVGWALSFTFPMLLVAPLVVAVASLAQRALAAVQGRLETAFISDPFAPDNTRYLAQFGLRAGLAGLTVGVALLAIPDIELAGMPGQRGQWMIIAVPLLVFVALQLVPSRPVSRSLNLVAGVVVVFLAFQLVQVHYRSGLDEAVDMAAPVSGEWYIGSAGRSTLINHHYTVLADQQYAVDLAIEHDGRTYDGDRTVLAAYYCWEQPILAPADGIVVAAENGHRDWPIGERDTTFAAGNVVVIDIGDGRFVQLAHLKMGSIPVAVGDRVAVGDVVGRCGNSGNTAEPHLHLQVQDSPKSVNEHQAELPQDELNTFPFRLTDVSLIRAGVDHDEQFSQLRRNDRIRTGG